ncbi:MAG TPA: sigma-70 family RNA polymerase sigma factor [Solirubrobacterales bacterium]|nr:sigma-70 family RNA polymerase sigma factor [Solirubrobacterales bacterium]
MSELALVLRARRGDELAFRRLERGLSVKFWWLARTHFGPGLEPEDLYQEALVGLHEAVGCFDARAGLEFESFAFGCAKRRVISAVRTSNRRKSQHLNQALKPSAASDDDAASSLEQWALRRYQPSVSYQAEMRGFLSAVTAAARQRLSDLERRALGLSVSGWAHAEIADLLGKDEKSVQNAIRRARGNLADELGEAGWPYDPCTVDEDRSREAKAGPKRAAISAVLKEAVRPLTKHEIADLAELPIFGLHKTLEGMENRGEAVAVDDGWSAPVSTAWPAHWKVTAAA